MKTIPAILLAVYTCGAYAQTEVVEKPTIPNYKQAVKAYVSGLFTPNHNKYNWRPIAVPFDYVHPSAAVMIQTKRGNYHELELSQLSFGRTEESTGIKDTNSAYKYRTDYRLYHTAIALRYEYIIMLNKRKEARFATSIGWSAMPYFERLSVMPYITSFYPMMTMNLGVRSFIVPRLIVNVSERVFLDANLPLCVLDMGTTSQNIQNPTLPAAAQKYSVWNLELMPGYFSARLGLGVKL